jgi:hypothetical protein
VAIPQRVSRTKKTDNTMRMGLNGRVSSGGGGAKNALHIAPAEKSSVSRLPRMASVALSRIANHEAAIGDASVAAVGLAG